MDNISQYIPILLPLVIIQVIFQIVSLVDLFKRQKEEIRGERVLWVFVILLMGILGPVLYFLLGRKQ
ncbi:MAG TPA: PLD nuclease N-terminal domain-containing protein [Dictyoglomaceae bacterium]|nr:PLD nuclease N-terminal domain-containing protein [Dictyoglomaceae bacterium]HOL40090.1 PLD nuclease N-terminal domain-containing protein [Dictyoglomaceae bacterium]HPP16739.1 PLD nuclease N-terminal domain-containing protein [Dictyoglomaceae bacterium]HPU43652.1 PLD nuclease N-terminal domain-containing protein [Dictyoglomaceae bacterium]